VRDVVDTHIAVIFLVIKLSASTTNRRDFGGRVAAFALFFVYLSTLSAKDPQSRAMALVFGASQTQDLAGFDRKVCRLRFSDSPHFLGGMIADRQTKIS
jgi:hypothetical protein